MTHAREVDLAPIRDAFQRSRMNVNQVAVAGGMDSGHVRRLLTAAPVLSRKRGKVYGPYPYRTCTYETAVKLARGMAIDPYEVGL